MNRADLAVVEAENIRVRQAFGLAGVSLDGLTQDQFTAIYPHADIPGLMSDPNITRQVERFAAMATVQDYFLDAQLRRGLSESVTGLVAKIQSPDVSGAALGAATDALTKISNLLDRREAAKREGGEQGLTRQLYRSGSNVSIRTIEGTTEFKLVEHLTYEQNIAAVRAMRCTTEAEAEHVLASMRSTRPMVVLNLRGF